MTDSKACSPALRKKSEDLEPEEGETLDLVFECSPLLRKAYRLREKLTRIFVNKRHTKDDIYESNT
jgi:hypothetical protein